MKYSSILLQSSKNKKINTQKIKLLSKIDKHLIDEKIHTLHHQVFQTIDCLQCANCCKTTSPIITNRDVERISKYLKIKPGVFTEHYLMIDADEDYIFKNTPCSFLNIENNECSIYEVRPKACAEYPHTNRKNMNEIFRLTLKNTLICPAVAHIFEKL
jgi:Fe-S-cluster containining protein